MQKRSHQLLASALLNLQQGFGSKSRNLVFLFGSFQPDCNPFSYLKGSLHGRALRGHNFPNSRRYIHRSISRLQQRKRWHLQHYYMLGKLTHYLADAFTCAHTDRFPANPRLHHQYETQLRHHLTAVLSAPATLRPTGRSDLSSAIEAMYRRYLTLPADVGTDTRYILHAASLAMALAPRAKHEPA